jgi:hypothetical protein
VHPSARRSGGLAIAIVVVAIAWLVPGRAFADGRLLDDDTFAVRSTGDLAIDGGLVVGFPAALTTGMSTGVGAGITRGCTCWFAYGARASWSTTSESSMAWTVTHQDLRLRATGAIRHAAGRGTFALRLGLGATVVHELRVRTQGMRAGLTGNDLETRAVDTLPAADLEGVISLHVTGPWLMVVSGGPSVDVFDGSLHAGWTAQLGVAWQP